MPDTLASHLTRLREHADMSLDDVAREAGYKGRSSVQRYFEDHTIETLKPAIAAKLAKAFYLKGDPPILAYDLGRMIFSPERLDGVTKEFIAKLLDFDLDDREGPAAVEYQISDFVPIIGDAHASNWMEASPSFDDDVQMLDIPFKLPQNGKRFYCLRLFGNSLNKVAPEGHFAICEKYGGRVSAFPSGCFVHIERTRNGFVEWSVKKVVWTPEGMEFHPESDDPAHQDPILLGDKSHTITVLGLVVGWYRPA